MGLAHYMVRARANGIGQKIKNYIQSFRSNPALVFFPPQPLSCSTPEPSTSARTLHNACQDETTKRKQVRHLNTRPGFWEDN